MAGLLALAANPAFAIISLAIAPSYDGIQYSAYPAGDKPQAGCSTPAGYTELDLGDGFGEWCDTTGEWVVTGGGSTSIQKIHAIYKDCGAGDCQFTARIDGDYSGNLVTSAAIGIGLRDGLTNTDHFLQGFGPIGDEAAVMCNYGTVVADTIKVAGAAGQTLPRYVAVTLDNSADTAKVHASADGTTYTEVCSIPWTYSTTYAYAFVTSRSGTASLTGTLTSPTQGTTITVYTPSDPPSGSPPTLNSSIPGQSATQGTAFSLTFSAYFSGATSYTASGFPGSSGLSESSDGVVSGTPTSSDVTASPFNLSLCGVNADGSTCDTVQFSISAPAASGDVFLIPTGTSSRTYNCASASGAAGSTWASIRTSGSATTPGPGDSIVLDNGTHSGSGTPLTFTNCSGSSSNYITIKNDVTGNGPAIISRTGGSSGGFVTKCSDCFFVKYDGTGKWSGAGAGDCGMASSWPTPPGTPQCGIVIKRANSGVATPSAYLKFDKFTSDITVQGVEIDGIQNNPAQGIGISMDDAGAAYSRTGNPGVYRKNLLMTNNYVHTTGASAIYLGPNWSEGNLPLRDVELSYNYTTDLGRRCVSAKSAIAGTNSIHHNYCDTAGVLNDFPGFGNCSTFHDGYGDFYNNIFLHCGENGFGWTVNANGPPSSTYGPFSSVGYNNIVAHTGETAALSGGGDSGITTFRASTSVIVVGTTLYNNTITDTGGSCISWGTNAAGAKVARDNILAACGAGGTHYLSNATTDTANNKSATVGAQNFSNAAADNYHLTSSSSACDAASNQSLNEDYEGTARPQDSANDQGADENASCP